MHAGLLALVLSTTQSCQKDPLDQQAPVADVKQPAALNVAETNRLQTVFAQALAKAVQTDAPLRAYLKAEATKQFDNDFDILYQVIKDQVIEGTTVHERLSKHVEVAADLASIESQLPLLTIFVPTLPSGFSAKTWNAAADVPAVAVSKLGENIVPFYDGKGQAGSIQPEQIPGFPILLVKLNERVTTGAGGNGTQRLATADANLTFHQNSQFTFRFGDASFDNVHPTAGSTARQAAIGSGDPARILTWLTATLFSRIMMAPAMGTQKSGNEITCTTASGIRRFSIIRGRKTTPTIPQDH